MKTKHSDLRAFIKPPHFPIFFKDMVSLYRLGWLKLLCCPVWLCTLTVPDSVLTCALYLVLFSDFYRGSQLRVGLESQRR